MVEFFTPWVSHLDKPGLVGVLELDVGENCVCMAAHQARFIRLCVVVTERSC